MFLVSYLRNCYHIQGRKSFTPVFPSRSFVVLALTLRCEVGVHLPSFACGHPVVTAASVQGLLSPYRKCQYPCWWSFDRRCLALFLNFCLGPLVCVSALHQHRAVLVTINHIVVSFESSKCESSNFLLFQIDLGCWGLCNSISILVSVSPFMQKTLRILTGVALNLRITLRKIAVLDHIKSFNPWTQNVFLFIQAYSLLF